MESGTYTVKQAAKRLGMNPQAIREGMKTGRLPVGIARRNEERWAYVIYKDWVARFLAGDPVTIPDGISDKQEAKKCTNQQKTIWRQRRS